jgi:hypothetical protein
VLVEEVVVEVVVIVVSKQKCFSEMSTVRSGKDRQAETYAHQHSRTHSAAPRGSCAPVMSALSDSKKGNNITDNYNK